MYRIVIIDEARRFDIPKLGSEWEAKIKPAIKAKLSTNPEVFGKPLKRSLKNYRKLRVGNYRVIFRIEDQQVKIIAIKHRSVVYKKIERRV